jgi:hypothetical protein
MFLQVRADGQHPWTSIKNIKIEGVFLAAGVANVNNAKFTPQVKPTVVRLSPTETVTMTVSTVNTDKFCAIFRLDKRRFGLAMTEVDRIFLKSMIEYMTAAANTTLNPNTGRPVKNNAVSPNTPLPKIEKLGASLSVALNPQNFTIGKLYKARKAWGQNRNRTNYEAKWLENFAQRLARAGGSNNEIQVAISGLRGVQMPTTSQNTGGQSRQVGTGQGQVVASTASSRPNTSLNNAERIIAAVASNENGTVNFEQEYTRFLRDHVGKGSRINEAINQRLGNLNKRSKNYNAWVRFYNSLKMSKANVNSRLRV